MTDFCLHSLSKLIPLVIAGNLIKAYTPKELKYDAIDIYPEDPDGFYTSFRVRACNSAHFIIAPKTNVDTGTYDVIFGSNDNSKYEILKGGKLLQSVIAYNILSAEQFRNFWVSWHEGNLTAGRGEVGQYHAIANYDSSAPTMYSVSFSTSNTCPGNWDIDQRVGMYHQSFQLPSCYNSHNMPKVVL